jgi:RNAse (barnase) inhibitor barstar
MASAKHPKDGTNCTVTPKYGWVYRPRKKTKHGEPGRWGHDKKMEAVTTYIATGNLSLVSKLIGVTYATLQFWKSQEWWKDQTDKLYDDDNIELSARLTKTLNKTLSVLDERLQNGDYLWDTKTQKLVRVPVKMREVNTVANTLMDKRALLRKQPTKISATDEGTNARLDKLAEAFTAFAKGKAHERIVNEIDGDFEEIDDAIPEEREEKL